MAGIPGKKENSAADTLCHPAIMLAVIVLPERDTPGMMAIAWAAPISQPSPKPT